VTPQAAPSSPRLPAALLWDVDGTLAETERDGHRVAFNRAFAEQGLDWAWDEATYRRLLSVSGGRPRIRAFARETGADLGADDLAAESRLEAIHRCKAKHYRVLLEEGAVPIRPGVRRLIGEATGAGVTLAVVTDSTSSSVLALADHLLPELRGLVPVFVHGGRVAVRKPSPQSYLLALRELGLPADRCLALEDSGKGACAAVAAGLAVLVTPSSTSMDDDFSCATAIVDHLGDPGRPTSVRRGPSCDAGLVDLAFCAAVVRSAAEARGRVAP
jgi:HAD superfamily hydrolase (TIGR01509 family)